MVLASFSALRWKRLEDERRRYARAQVTLRRDTYYFRPEVGRGNPLNLSILLSGGKETNEDSPSNGE